MNIYYFNNTKENETQKNFVRKLGQKPLLYWHFFIPEKTRKLIMGIYRKLPSTK